jgi:hypothetical protein
MSDVGLSLVVVVVVVVVVIGETSVCVVISYL